MRNKLLLFILLLLIPFYVYAEDSCNPNNIIIESITQNNKTEDVYELSQPTIENNKIKLDLKMSSVGDNIEYKLIVKNTSEEEYNLNLDNLLSNTDYISYSFSNIEDSNIIEPNSTKEILLKVEYKNEVPIEQFTSNTLEDNKTISLDFLKKEVVEETIIDAITNPNTKDKIIIYTIVAIISLTITILLIVTKNKKYIKYMIIPISLIVVPITIKALCECQLEIESNIQIEKKKTCTYLGELVQGAEYTNGQYTYRYMQQHNGSEWVDMTSDGWGMKITDKDSTDDITTKMCTSINSKPITSLFGVFMNSKATYIDVSSFDTSNVTTMRSAFNHSAATTIVGLDTWDTSNVKVMTFMFYCTEIKDLNINTFNTENVTNFSNMFQGAKVTNLQIDSINTSSATNLQQMFHGAVFEELDISGWDLTNATNVKSIFRSSSIKKVYVKDETAKTKLENSSFKPTDLIIDIKQ
ncbi:MAG: BspA family leucine-rich repeat surface protein [Bacilli bacterium]|nr:BspA family leucine-rich repeat surface protein [Bacilli bacterium]